MAADEPKAARVAKAEAARTAKKAETTKLLEGVRKEKHRIEKAQADFESASRAEEETTDLAISSQLASDAVPALDSVAVLWLTDQRGAAGALVAFAQDVNAKTSLALGQPFNGGDQTQLAFKRCFIAHHPGAELSLHRDQDSFIGLNSHAAGHYAFTAAVIRNVPAVMRHLEQLEEFIATEVTQISPNGPEDLEYCQARLKVRASFAVRGHAVAHLDALDREYGAAKAAQNIARNQAEYEALAKFRSGESDDLPPGWTHADSVRNYSTMAPATRDNQPILRRVMTAAEKSVIGLLRGTSE